MRLPAAGRCIASARNESHQTDDGMSVAGRKAAVLELTQVEAEAEFNANASATRISLYIVASWFRAGFRSICAHVEHGNCF